MPRNNHRKQTKEVIDVDEFHSRYEDPEGVVQFISVEEFRQSWRIHRKERRAAIAQTQSGSRTIMAESSGHQNQGQSSTQRQVVQRDFPSTIGPSNQKAVSQKRVLPSDPVDISKPFKRQRTHAGPSGLTHFCRDSTLSGDELPVFRGNSPIHPQAPPSPDLMIVDEKPRQQQSPAAMSSIVVKSSIRRTPSPKYRTQEGSPLYRKTATSSTTAPRKLENKAMDVIELFSDDENRAIVQPTQQYRQPAYMSVAQRSNSPIEFPSDSDDSDDDWCPPGLDLNDPDMWLPIPKNVNKEDGVFHSLKDSVTSHPPLPHYRCQDTSRWSPPPPPPRQPLYIWDKLRLAENLRWRPRPRPTLMQPRKLITRPKDIDLNLERLNIVTSFKQAPGTINAIEQFEGLAVIGSACDGGLADEPNETQSPYNRAGSLSVLSDNRLEVLEGHMRRGLQPKHYTINDIKFDPTCNSFASIGEDRKCRFWALDDESEETKWKNTVTFPYSSVPHALAFRPGSSILAVAEKKVQVYDLSEEVIMPPHPFHLHDRGSLHMIGPIAWGCETTEDHLFASSEPTQQTFTGAHKAFDLRTQKTIYQFDVMEAGDAIAVDAVGATLGLCTQAGANHHILRLYDIRRRSPKAFTSVDLLPFSSRDNDSFEGEMNVATFSPDQIYFALARNDNQTHLYDRRMLGKQGSEPLFKYHHFGELKTVSKRESYGIVQAQWLQSSWTTRTCLATGGEDGCIRMWDPSVSAHNVENGKVLAEVNYDISQFSIGDPFVGEYRLVVGDSSGEVTIFDHICG